MGAERERCSYRRYGEGRRCDSQGHVESLAEKHAAAMATRRVKGVKALADEIDVQIPLERRRGDAEIAATALDRLAGDVSVPGDAVTVTAEQGWITLTGEVERYHQKVAAEPDVRRLFGVVGVSNQITIKPGIEVSNIGDDIMHALHRSWFFDPKTITVSIAGGKVRLTGAVHSQYDRQVAAETAWAATGVTDVVGPRRITRAFALSLLSDVYAVNASGFKFTRWRTISPTSSGNVA